MNYHSFNSPKNNIEIDLKQKCNCPDILIADDDPFNLIALELLISKLGFTCLKAFNGTEAVELFQKQREKECGCKFRLILMDYQMPVMNGIEATKEIIKICQDANEIPAPIIACSAFEQNNDIQNFFAAGISDYLVKPITMEKLKSIILEFIQDK